VIISHAQHFKESTVSSLWRNQQNQIAARRPFRTTTALRRRKDAETGEEATRAVEETSQNRGPLYTGSLKSSRRKSLQADPMTSKATFTHWSQIKGGYSFPRTTEEVARYAGEKYSVVGAYVRTAILTMTQQVPVRPTAPAPQGTPPVVDAVDQAIFNEEIRQFVRNKAAIIAAMKAIYSVIWGQCSEGLRSKLKSKSSYNGTSADANSLALLKEIRSEMTGFKKRNYLPHSVHSIMRELYNLSQGKHRTNQEY
jgi:hypothetical protein